MRDRGKARDFLGPGRRSRTRYWQPALVALGVAVLVAGAAYRYFGEPRASGVFHPLTVRVVGIRSDAGLVRVTVCEATERFPDGCKLAGEASAAEGVVLVHFPAVEKGAYAAAAFHDENSNGQLDMYEGRRVPSEGVAFSNDVFGSSGVPSFDKARFEFNGSDQRLRMQYMR